MDQEIIRKLGVLSEVYTPAYPIEIKELFSGRDSQFRNVFSFIGQKGYHCLIFGDRGVGKTSFSNIVKVVCESDRQVAKISCNSDDTYESMWINVLSKLSIKHEEVKQDIGFNTEPEKTENVILLSNLVSGEDITIPKLLSIFQHLGNPIIILDEFDRLDPDRFNKRLLTDTIKAISDNLPDVTIIIVGVSEDVGSLILEHESIERNIGQIHMPAMSPLEIEAIIKKGEQPLGLKFSQDVVNKIIELSSGYPHFTHALCYYAATSAIYDRSDTIDAVHLSIAIRQTIDNAHESLRNSYRIATLATKQNIFSEVLYAASIVQTDEYGYFQANDLEPILSEILGKDTKVNNFTFHLGKFCIAERGEILRVTGSKNRHRYKFKNPLMRAFIRLKIEAQSSVTQ
ncbi:orc1/cdc6 family replication initiation protein [Chitinophaga oryzae]|uniref:Orc1/cdc6 family replication initiation protein n=1 Tax=Chitinophaga oryzae TaxID=2725414 RepID=A0AAE6ZMH3_9BACT|nr:AAA family ATPase [Chitinophaga oryzae]QJB35946.1 orc1/cdc6 family replication initiation protein [Chitinophaga oryzae]